MVNSKQSASVGGTPHVTAAGCREEVSREGRRGGRKRKGNERAGEGKGKEGRIVRLEDGSSVKQKLRMQSG